MLVYEKKVDNVRHLFGTMNDVPSESDNQLVYKDAYGDSATVSLNNKYLDDGHGGITMVTPEGTASFLAVNIKKTDNSLVNIIPGGSYETPTVSSIAVKTAPTKVTYTEGDKLDMKGLVLTVTYSNSTSQDIAYGDTGITYSPADGATLATTDTKVTITYANKTAEQAITVNQA